MSYHLHKPGETLDYSVDWQSLLEAANDTVSTVDWALAPALPGQVLSASGDGFSRSCKVSGLTAGLIYTLTCTATSAQGRIVSRGFAIRCPKP